MVVTLDTIESIFRGNRKESLYLSDDSVTLTTNRL